MAASYVLVTGAAVLIVETILLSVFASSLLGSDLQARLQNQAARDAQVLSVTATKMADDLPGADSWDLLFWAMKSSGSDTSLVGSRRDDAEGIPIIAEGRGSTKGAAEALVTANGEIVTSSALGTFPARGAIGVPVPGQKGGGGEAGGSRDDMAWWMSPVLLRSPIPAKSPMVGPDQGGGIEKGGSISAQKNGTLTVIGYVYVRAPLDGGSPSDLLPFIIPGVLVLALVVPVGLVFGLLSTRRLTGRVQRLAEVTAAVAEGDFRPRVRVTGRDEVGRLEHGFNRMTGQLGAAVDAERRVARTEARQAERSRIARELHDSISQDLFSLSLLAAGMRRAAPEKLRVEAETMERTAARTMREMQALLLELRPVALEDAGLVPTLEALCRAYETRLGIRVPATLEEVSLSAAAEHAVLRLVQEALGNAIKHADPSTIDVRLRRTGEKVIVEIHDDGKGFDPSTAGDRHGMGLTLMRERVEELGGTYTLRSEPGEGTAVIAALPLETRPGQTRAREAGPEEGRPEGKPEGGADRGAGDEVS